MVPEILPVADAHHRPTLGAALQERPEGVRQLLEVNDPRDLVQVYRVEVPAPRHPLPQLAPAPDVAPVGVYPEEVHASQDEGHHGSL
jgi:hypothetical protein